MSATRKYVRRSRQQWAELLEGVRSPTVRKRTRTIKNCLLNRLIDNIVYELPKIDIKDSYLALISVSRIF